MDIRHILSRIVFTMVFTSLKVYISDFEETLHSKIPTIPHPRHPAPCSVMIILNAITWIIALLKLDLNPVHPAFHKHSFPTRSHHDSDPQEISTLISWVSAEISTASPFCKAGIFVSSSWVLHRMCPIRPWVQNRLGWNILGSRAQIF